MKLWFVLLAWAAIPIAVTLRLVSTRGEFRDGLCDMLLSVVTMSHCVRPLATQTPTYECGVILGAGILSLTAMCLVKTFFASLNWATK